MTSSLAQRLPNVSGGLTELRQRLWYVLLAIIVYRVGSHILVQCALAWAAWTLLDMHLDIQLDMPPDLWPNIRLDMRADIWLDIWLDVQPYIQSLIPRVWI